MDDLQFNWIGINLKRTYFDFLYVLKLFNANQ